MKSESEVKEVIKDWKELLSSVFYAKYGIESMREGVGFLKAVHWVLELEYEE